MKKQFFISAILLLHSFFLFSQEEATHNRWSGAINYANGNATLKHNNLGVLNGNLDALLFGVNFDLSKKHDIFISSGFNVISFRSNFFNGVNQSSLNNTYFQIPLSINDKWYFSSSKNLYTVYGLGVYANYLGKSESQSFSENVNLKNTGFNFGHFINWGFGYKLSDNSTIDLGINLMFEFNAIKKNNIEQKQSDINLLRIGYSHRF